MFNAKDARILTDQVKIDTLEREINRVEQFIIDTTKRGKDSVKFGNISLECRRHLEKFGYNVSYYGQGYAEDNGYIIKW